MLSLRVHKAIFSIPCTERILGAVRLSVALITLLWICLGPFPQFYPQEEALLYLPQKIAPFLPPLGGTLFSTLKLVIIFGCMSMLWQRTALVATRLTAAAFAILNCYVASFSELWNYNTHLNILLIALSFAPKNNAESSCNFDERRSAIIFFMRMQVAIIYLQTGLAKLVHGGLEWPEKAPYIHMIVQEGWAAPWLSQWPQLVWVLGACVIAIELLLPALFMCRRTHFLAVAVATLLHFGMYLAVGISFWHLWALFPALFVIGSRQRLSSTSTWSAQCKINSPNN
jgi:hypothetical protein